MKLIISDEAKKEIHEMCVRRVLDNKFTSKTRAELEQEFEYFINNKTTERYVSSVQTSVCFREKEDFLTLKELFYNILKRIN